MNAATRAALADQPIEITHTALEMKIPPPFLCNAVSKVSDPEHRMNHVPERKDRNAVIIRFVQ
jgi:hypothetical protein